MVILAMVTIRCAMGSQFLEFEIFAPKVEVARTALQRQYADRLTGAELDHPFTCHVHVMDFAAGIECEASIIRDLRVVPYS
ncbi:hypothetical protein [Rhizobium rhizogenes]|jgi:hypothetical protein|uniref:hypothetical protein n=1 Tax=Rhizobium rhizogenes TaxID=359 RepID=UPI00064579CE|nr:hypothetical protein [Rhizobium rhizogenes]